MNGPSLEKFMLAWGTAPASMRAASFDALVGQQGGKHAQPLILKPKDAARMLSCTTRTLQNLKARGVLAPVRFPGNAKAHGYKRSDIERLAAGMEG